jgi:hypothetical protein
MIEEGTLLARPPLPGRVRRRARHDPRGPTPRLRDLAHPVPRAHAVGRRARGLHRDASRRWTAHLGTASQGSARSGADLTRGRCAARSGGFLALDDEVVLHAEPVLGRLPRRPNVALTCGNTEVSSRCVVARRRTVVTPPAPRPLRWAPLAERWQTCARPTAIGQGGPDAMQAMSTSSIAVAGTAVPIHPGEAGPPSPRHQRQGDT